MQDDISHHLEIKGACASYGKVPVLKGVDLTLGKGEVVALIGPSGSGKSTVLRMVMGLTPPSSGDIELDGQSVNYGKSADVRRVRDRIAVVFQQYNLFQNMDVMRNVTIAPLKIKKRTKTEVVADAERLLAKVGLADKLKAYPDELSGGQQQRVAIARALCLNPEILLLDEVTSALDPELVNEVLDSIRNLAAEGMTMLIVSHEMAFVREVATRVIFMDDGLVVEAGPPKEIFDNPKTQRAKDFVGKILRH